MQGWVCWFDKTTDPPRQLCWMPLYSFCAFSIAASGSGLYPSQAVARGWERWDQPVAQHRFFHLGRIRCAGRQQLGHVLEILRAKHARAEGAQASCRFGRAVCETMHDAAFDEDGLAGRNIDILFIDPPGRGAGQPVDRWQVEKSRSAAIRCGLRN